MRTRWVHFFLLQPFFESTSFFHFVRFVPVYSARNSVKGKFSTLASYFPFIIHLFTFDFSSLFVYCVFMWHCLSGNIFSAFYFVMLFVSFIIYFNRLCTFHWHVSFALLFYIEDTLFMRQSRKNTHTHSYQKHFVSSEDSFWTLTRLEISRS